jgi:cysteine desulfurase
MESYWRGGCASPSGIHSEAKKNFYLMEEARVQICSLLGAGEADGEIVFTGNGTEAVNLGILGFARANLRFGQHLVSSAIEHPSVLNAIQVLEEEGFSSSLVSVDELGRFDFDSVSRQVGEKTLLICLQLVNSDVGTIQSLREVGQLARAKAIGFFVDATAAAGRVPIDVLELNADLLALSPSAFGGPVGIGALYKKSRVSLKPLYYGGGQEGGLRPGEENVPGIVGAGIAAEMAHAQLGPNRVKLTWLQSKLWGLIQSRIEGVHLNGPIPGADRLCHQLSVTIDGVDAEGLVLFADMRGLAIATSGGCLNENHDRHYVLAELGLSQESAKRTVSLGVGLNTTEEEIDRAVDIIAAGANRLRSMSPSWSR